MQILEHSPSEELFYLNGTVLFQLDDTYLLELVFGRQELEALISIIRVFGWVWVSGKLACSWQAVSRRAGGGPPADGIEPPTPKYLAGALTKQPMARRYVKKYVNIGDRSHPRC
jgi:hypothetical protein